LRVLALVSVTAVVLAYIGWRHAGQPVLDSAFHALKTVSMGSVYDKLDEQRASNVYLEAGRWLGVVVEFSTLAFLFTSVFSEQTALLRARLFFRGHVIVIGETEFADRFGEMDGSAVIHLRNVVDPVEQVGTLIRLPFAGHVEHSFKTASAHRARAVLVATSDDARSISLAMAAQRRHAHQEDAPQLLVRLHDYWLAQRLHNLPGAEFLQAVSEPALAARDAMRRHPVFLAVDDQDAYRCHALLAGEPDWLEAMMAEIILSGGTLRQARPALTFACAGSESFRARLFQRYPEIGEEADLAFIELGGSNPWELTSFQLAGVSGPPLTAVFFLFPKVANTISGYLGFLQQARAAPGFTAPIFVLADSSEFESAVPGARLQPYQAVPFGAHRQIIAACGLLTGELTEQAYHNAYLAFADPNGKATKSWAQLGEDYRSSNRRAVAHIYAKLFEAGFDVRGWMAGHDLWSQLPELAQGERLFRDPAERERLAALEHKRWISDRRLNGWSHGEARDDIRKLHPDIKPFEELRPEIREYSYQFIDLLDAILPRSLDGMRRVEKPKTA
jgi:hypothetical protein